MDLLICEVHINRTHNEYIKLTDRCNNECDWYGFNHLINEYLNLFLRSVTLDYKLCMVNSMVFPSSASLLIWMSGHSIAHSLRKSNLKNVPRQYFPRNASDKGMLKNLPKFQFFVDQVQKHFRWNSPPVQFDAFHMDM